MVTNEIDILYPNSDDTAYESDSGYTMGRENKQGIELWVLRFHGTFVDRDQYRHDLAERNKIKLAYQMRNMKSKNNQ